MARPTTDLLVICLGTDSVENSFYSCARRFPWGLICLRRLCPVTAMVYLLILRSSPSNMFRRLFRGRYPGTVYALQYYKRKASMCLQRPKAVHDMHQVRSQIHGDYSQPLRTTDTYKLHLTSVSPSIICEPIV